MSNWISENIGTIFVAVLLLAVVALIACRQIRNRKKGKTSCGCGCAHCAMAGMCHKQAHTDHK